MTGFSGYPGHFQYKEFMIFKGILKIPKFKKVLPYIEMKNMPLWHADIFHSFNFSLILLASINRVSIIYLVPY